MLLSKEFIITNDSFIISGIFIFLLLFSVKSFSNFIVETNDNIRKNLITQLVSENILLKNNLISNENLNYFKMDFNVIQEIHLDLPSEENPLPFLNT